MIKIKGFLLLIMCGLTLNCFSQGLGVNTCTPDSSSVLDISSSDKGMLIPRLTTAARDAISNPANGLMLYNTDDEVMNIFTSKGWESVSNEATESHTNFTINTTPVTWTGMPSGSSEFLGFTHHRIMADLSGADSIRLEVNVSQLGFSGSKIRGEFSDDGGTVWKIFDGVAGPQISLGSIGLQVSPWVPIQNDGKNDVIFRLVGFDGDGITSPVIGLVTMQVK